MSIKYIEGDLFETIKNKTVPIVIAHVCNNKGVFGSGFVVPLSKHFPDAEVAYLQGSMRLGDVNTAHVGNVMVCNMIAQELGGKRPLFYNHLATCLDQVAKVIRSITVHAGDCEVHSPAFGTMRAGGDWSVISALIEDCWIRALNPVPPINIYYLPGTFLPPAEA